MSRGDIVRVVELRERSDLNGSLGLVVAEPTSEGRVPVCILGSSPIIGINVRPANAEVLGEAPGNVKIQAWNDLGVAYCQQRMFAKSLDALEEAVRLAPAYEGAPGVREESGRSLSNIAWLCLVMSQNSVDFRPDVTVKQVMEWAMRQMFREVIESLPKDAKVLFGAGRIPGKEERHLIMTVVDQEDSEPRYFVVDEERHLVYEHGQGAAMTTEC